jgi:peptide/nickel transport system substrate-binding protein
MIRSLSILLTLSLLLTDCRPSGDGAFTGEEGEPRYGGTAVIGSSGDLQSMNTLTSSDYNSRLIQQYVLLMPLVLYDAELTPQPYLAARWDTARVSPEQIELTFHLRQDVRWHDGTPTTAHDVLFTYERAREPATAFPNANAFELYERRAEVIDEHTIRFRLRPHAEYMAIWFDLPIMPRHLLREAAPAELAAHPYGTSTPVGNGPFRFVRRVPGQEWVFEANPDFPEGLGGRPYLDRLVYRTIPEQTTLLTELLTGRIDVYLNPNPAQTERIASASGARLLTAPFRSHTYLGWNTRLPQFSDARVRRALTMAIDRQAIVDALLYGHGDPGRSLVTPAHWSFDADDPELQIPHDLDAARALLLEAGWNDHRGDGVLRDDTGQPLRFTLVTNHGNDLRRDVMEIVQAQLRRVGVQVEARTVEWNTLINMLEGSAGTRAERRGFEAVVSGFVDNFRKDDANILHSRHLDGPYQETGFTHPRVDMLLDTLALITDREVAAPLWREYQRLVTWEAPYTVLFYPHRTMGARARVRGIELDVRGDLVSVARWWIRE